MESRQDCPVHARGQLHGFVFVEGVRQGRHHHLGDAGNRLSVGRAGPPRIRASWLSARAAFSWYTHSPTRVRYPYARGVLEMFRARARLGDSVLAWADIVADPLRRRSYQQARGQGRLVRVSWEEAIDIAAAAHAHHQDVRPRPLFRILPDPRDVDGVALCGNTFHPAHWRVMTSFYDWYADLPVASPQVFGDQTDVPESGDWWDATYLMMWGSNVPVTRTRTRTGWRRSATGVPRW